MTSHIAVDTAKVVILALSLDQGDTMVSPSPDPTSIRTKVSVEAANAPAIIGPQLTADDEDSTGALPSVAMKVDAMFLLLSHEQHEKDDDRNWNTEKPKQNAATHVDLLSNELSEWKTATAEVSGVAVGESGGFGHLVGGCVRQAGQRLVRHRFFAERLIEQLRGVVHAEHLRPALQRAVARDLVVFDRLGR